jgi:acid phosphatase type 7
LRTGAALVAAIVLMAAPVRLGGAATTTQTFAVVADSYVSSGSPNTNYGAKPTLRALASSPVQRSYLRFNVQGLSGGVSQATLRLYTRSSSNVGYDVRAVADTSWGEKTLTYKNAPPVSATISGSSGTFTSGHWTSVDVTPLVTGNGAVSFAVTTTATSAISLASREYSSTSFAPQLVVDTAAVAPSNTSVPKISGSAAQGQTLTADPGAWTGTAPISYTYQWRRCDASGGGCVDIATATGSTYSVGSDDVGSTLVVVVNASNSAGSASAPSAPTAVVSATAVAPSNTSVPKISGSAAQGQTLAADPGAWTGTAPISYTYQWRRCDASGGGCVEIATATGSTYVVGSGDVGSTLVVVVNASNGAGSASAPSAPTPVVNAISDPVIAAAGDIACSSAPLTSGSSCHFGVTSDLIASDPSITDVLTLGDNQYDCGDYANYLSYFDPTWGRFMPKLHPVPGNHEYQTAPGGTTCLPSSTVAAQGYFDYFNGPGAATGPAGNRGQGYYSYDVGTWHLIALNSNCSQVSCAAGSPQETWLKNDLATHPAACTLAYWHHPRFSSGEHGDNLNVTDLMVDLDHAGADVVLNGHDHDYERFAPQNAQGALDPDHGIREFVVGTGGRNHYGFVSTQPNSEIRDATAFGILKLTLHPTGYDWQFVAEPGSGFTDSGTAPCHGASSDTSTPTAPTGLTATATAPTQVNLAWTASSDDVGVVGYEVFRNGTLIGTSNTTTYTDATSQAATKYTYTVEAYDLASNLSAPSASAIVTTPGDTTPPSAPTNLAASAASNTVQLTWSASTDNVGVTGYQVFRNGSQIATAPSTTYTDTSVQGATTYTYTVSATDAAGNVSAASNAVSLTTPSGILSFVPVADAYVEQDTPTTNHGTSTQIIADNSPIKNLLLKFAVSGINGRPVTSAKLRLYCVDPSPYGGDFRPVTDTSWNETTVNWNTAPSAAATSLGTIGAVVTGNWYELDVTPLITGDGTFSIKAISTSGDGANYSSREGANPPQLILTLG